MAAPPHFTARNSFGFSLHAARHVDDARYRYLIITADAGADASGHGFPVIFRAVKRAHTPLLIKLFLMPRFLRLLPSLPRKCWLVPATFIRLPLPRTRYRRRYYIIMLYHYHGRSSDERQYAIHATRTSSVTLMTMRARWRRYIRSATALTKELRSPAQLPDSRLEIVTPYADIF